MRQRGRKSAAALTVVGEARLVHLVKAPVSLTDGQLSVWLATVNALPADWFSQEQLPLLESYCRHVAYGRMVAAELDRAEPEWLSDDEGLKRYQTLLAIHEKESRAMSALATRLRLTNQSTVDPRTMGRAKAAQVKSPKPWQTVDEEE